MKTLEFYYDYGSPTSYLAYRRLEHLCAEYELHIDFKPVLLGAVLKATNNQTPANIPLKGRYMRFRDLPRFVKKYEIDFNFNPNFPINTLHLMRGAISAKRLNCFSRYNEVVFNGMWVERLDLADERILSQRLEEFGMNSAQIIQDSISESVKEELKVVTTEAVSRGVFGAPTMFLDGDMFFGQDRLDFIEDELQKESK